MVMFADGLEGFNGRLKLILNLSCSCMKVDSYTFQCCYSPRREVLLITTINLLEIRTQEIRISIFDNGLPYSSHEIQKGMHVMHR